MKKQNKPATKSGSNQEKFDDVVMKFIIKGLHPLRTVEDESFIEYTNGEYGIKPLLKINITTLTFSTELLGMSVDKYGRTLKIMSRHMLKSKIDLTFESQRNHLIKIFSAIDHIGITADIWSSKHRSFMGVTAHWIDVKTYQRRYAILSCSRFVFPHTNDRIANHLKEVCDVYGITEKIIATTTDNASNFDKAFREFGIPIEWHFVDDAEFNPVTEVDYTEIDTALSLHIKCASHTFSLIGVKDASKAMRNSSYFNKHTSAFKKLNRIWNCANKPKASETIVNILGKSIHRPVSTRWNSVYDCIVKILKLDQSKLRDLMVALEIPEFSVIDMAFLHEYVKVLTPIARALDCLQAECYFALLLPMVHNTKQDLLQMKNENLKHTEPLLDEVLNGMENRFGYLFDFDNERCKPALVATCSHPYFKTRWLIGELYTKDNLEKIRLALNSAANSINIKGKQKEGQTVEIPRGKLFLYLVCVVF